MNQLREWQHECISQAIDAYSFGSQFFCQATPGAGKTFMAATLGKSLRLQGRIDFILCFSPSSITAFTFRKTFEAVLGTRFDGRIGASGASMTFSAMLSLSDSYWRLLEENRVLVIFDEIHHCAGSVTQDGNAWGRIIIEKVENKAAFTLSLSGTPWRTDGMDIPTFQANQNGNRVIRYIYSLRRAVAEKVCRIPQVTLIDNRQLDVWEDQEHLGSYNDVASFLDESGLNYQTLLNNREALAYILSLANQKLGEIRREVHDAAGLIVTSSVQHAYLVKDELEGLGESAIVVTHQSSDALQSIQTFQAGTSRWIISVGMISEGTDIPRLQVCCHLSRIRTELHFRQVLGRILRHRGKGDLSAWLYLLAEPTLSEFAGRVAEELPEHAVLQPHLTLITDDPKLGPSSEVLSRKTLPAPSDSCDIISLRSHVESGAQETKVRPTVELSARYHQKVLALFDHTIFQETH